ncbi:MAG: ATP-dependent protease ATPase subunit HslU [bacterium]|nr:ATP-dependent protease ATPase subunit HslU [bacterium]
MDKDTDNHGNFEELLPRQIVEELDRYIVGQNEAKRAVAVALRNRYRRERLPKDMRSEVVPKNIMMIGPTGVGKTEIARRLAKLTKAPFVKVEATKYTEVGYVGRDVESMIRDLAEAAVHLVAEEYKAKVRDKAKSLALERILDKIVKMVQDNYDDYKNCLEADLAAEITNDIEAVAETENAENNADAKEQSADAAPQGSEKKAAEQLGLPEDLESLSKLLPGGFGNLLEMAVKSQGHPNEQAKSSPKKLDAEDREKLKKLLLAGSFDSRLIEIEVDDNAAQDVQLISNAGIEELGVNFSEILGGLLPKRKKKRKLSVSEALEIMESEEADKLVDFDVVKREAIERAESRGIVFLDEIDKIAGEGTHGGNPDVSRGGVQRDILPIVEGSAINTKYGIVHTDHILFIAAGAFHETKPSELIPELQGRFPIRVNLTSLGEKDLQRILVEPKNALTRQYEALLAVEGIELSFTEDGIAEMARMAAEVNAETDNIGARRLHTIMERVLDKISFDAAELSEKKVVIDSEYVKQQLSDVVESRDLSKFIL